jgi:branched-chain amino acid transport system substrate-binding protein
MFLYGEEHPLAIAKGKAKGIKARKRKGERKMKKCFLFPLGVATVVVFLFMGAGFAADEPNEIRVGCNTPLTGMFAGFGGGGAWGVEAAADDINKLGGVFVKELGRKLPVKVIVVDNESDPGKSATLEEELILRHKVHCNAPPNQPLPLVIPQADLADKYKIPRVSGGTPMEPWLSLRRDAKPSWQYSWTFGFAIATHAPKGAYWDKPGYSIMDTWVAMLNKFGDETNKKVGVFASDEPDGRGWYSLFPPALEKLGYHVVGTDKKLGLLPLETTYFSSLIRSWKEADVEIMWGNSPSPFFATMWRQARSMGFKPKMVSVGRAPLFYTEVNAWGDDLPLGVGVEIWWDPSFQNCPGFGNTTPKSLTERWIKDTGQPLNPSIGWGYQIIQILVDAIQRAGSLKPEAINDALAKTDMMTIAYYVKFDKEHYNQKPLAYGQWVKTDKPWKWECPVTFSEHSFIKATAKPIFPIPYK